MSNVNNLNGVPNFGHGEESGEIIHNDAGFDAIDELVSDEQTNGSAPRLHKSKVKSAAQKILGGKY